MSAHACKELTDGCFRCELNRDEAESARADALAEGWVEDEYGNLYGFCNSCGEERQEFEDCCTDGEIVPYQAAT